ncbi:hypothetical protein AT1219_30213 [Vibrio alginolyticus]|jgi:hypothetical protein
MECALAAPFLILPLLPTLTVVDEASEALFTKDSFRMKKSPRSQMLL